MAKIIETQTTIANIPRFGDIPFIQYHGTIVKANCHVVQVFMDGNAGDLLAGWIKGRSYCGSNCGMG